MMHEVSISSKFQVVIPKYIRQILKWKSGSKVIMFPYKNRLEMVLEQDVKSLRGLLKGMDTHIEKEKDRL